MKLRYTVNRFSGVCMLYTVNLLENLMVKAVISTQVYHLHACIKKRGYDLHRGAVRHGCENNVRAGRHFLCAQIFELKIIYLPEMSMFIPYLFSLFAARCRCNNIRIRVHGEQTQKLSASVSRSAYDSDVHVPPYMCGFIMILSFSMNLLPALIIMSRGSFSAKKRWVEQPQSVLPKPGISHKDCPIVPATAHSISSHAGRSTAYSTAECGRR